MITASALALGQRSIVLAAVPGIQLQIPLGMAAGLWQVNSHQQSTDRAEDCARREALLRQKTVIRSDCQLCDLS